MYTLNAKHACHPSHYNPLFNQDMLAPKLLLTL